ncbi:hypothetical protein CQA77_29515, partial [Klebsiella pneumoniae]
MPEESAQGTPTRQDRKRNASAYGGAARIERRVIDVRYVIRPHENFVKQVMASNKRKQQTELRAIKHGMIDHDI